MDTPGLCLCVCVGVGVCPRTLVLLPSPSLISLHLPPPPTRPVSSLLPYGVRGGPSPGFLFKGKPRGEDQDE